MYDKCNIYRDNNLHDVTLVFGDGEFCHHAFWSRKKVQMCAKNIPSIGGWAENVLKVSMVLEGGLKVD